MANPTLEPTLEPALEHRATDVVDEPTRSRATLLDPWAIALLATVVSAAWACRPSLWFDEGATISASASRTLPELWRLLSHIDAVHGAYYLLMHGWFAVFPPTEFWSRVPSALAVGVAAAGVTVFTKQFSTRPTAICAGAIFAILPRMTWAGMEARPYAFVAAAGVWLTVLFVAAVRRGRPRRWVWYALALMVSILLNLNLVLLVPAYGAMLPLLAPEYSRKAPALWWAASSIVAAAAMVPFMVFAHAQVWQVNWIYPVSWHYAFDIILRQYFDHSVAFAVLSAVLIVAAVVVARLTRVPAPAGGTRRLLIICTAWIVIPTAIVVIYSAISEPIYYPRYLIFTAPAMGVVLAVCIVTLARRPWLIAAAVLVFAIAAVPDYLFTQRWPYAKEGWDYSQVADLISSHAAPGDCLMVDNTVPWKPGPIRALLATRPAAFRSLIDVERGVYGPKVGSLWDGHVAVWLTTAKINKCSTIWTITNKDSSLPDHQWGQLLPPGSAFGRTDAYRFPGYLGFHIVERWQFHYSQVVKSTR
jgi:mannosyltransferase